MKYKYKCELAATPGGGGGRAVLMGIPDGGVPLGSLNPDTISDQKMKFSTPVFGPDL